MLLRLCAGRWKLAVADLRNGRLLALRKDFGAAAGGEVRPYILLRRTSVVGMGMVELMREDVLDTLYATMDE